MYFWIESGLAVLSIGIACTFPQLGARWFARAEQLLDVLSRRPGLAVVVVGLAALAARAALLPVLSIPQPGGYDEFGYLLLGDTFAHGRLTNPTHPMWVHFETFHIIWQPTYTAKYYPAPGLILALGQMIMGHPFWGVWLSVGLMCAAICWMLQGWLPPKWALLGGLLAVVRLGTFSYWANSYWGGAVAAIGGALALGALPRIKRSQRVRDALLMGLGLAIMANSRPYEGLFFGLMVMGSLALWLVGKKRPSLPPAGTPPLTPLLREDGVKARWKHVAAPLLLTLVLTGCAMGYYFWRTTGSPWDTPFLIYERTYSPAPQFPWPPLKPVPAAHHQILRDYYEGPVLERYKLARTAVGFVALKLDVLMTLVTFYLGPILTLPLLAALATAPYGFSWRDSTSDTRFLVLVCATVVAGSMLPIWFLPHYAAPITCAILALVLLAMRYIRSKTWRGKPTGLFLTRAVPLVSILMLVLRIGAKPLHLPEPPRWLEGGAPTWCAQGTSNTERAEALAELQRFPGRQLVIVRYGPNDKGGFRAWVYNGADIDSAKVLWAQDMGPAKNAELINYFKDRSVWALDANGDPPRLSPYPHPTDGKP